MAKEDFEKELRELWGNRITIEEEILKNY